MEHFCVFGQGLNGNMVEYKISYDDKDDVSKLQRNLLLVAFPTRLESVNPAPFQSL